MSKRSNSSLFLMEQLVVILIFAICAAACVKIFVNAYLTTHQAIDVSQALLVAESGAEAYQAVTGDTVQLAVLLGGKAQGSSGVTVYYNGEWQPCAEAEAAYILRIDTLLTEASFRYGDLTVEKSTGEELVAFALAAGGMLYE